ncbi:hypothetical protein N7507_007250 [Penicillium longicatenatum]|nr:hypothetical protein N7507_007250 [Penicillium longicatenatum]
MWCLPCLRLAVQGFKPENGEMFEIICMTDTARTDGRCVACVPNRGRICESTPDAMDGNACDFIRFLNELSPIWENEAPLHVRVAAAKLQKDLCRAFIHVESLHRNANGISGRRLFKNRTGARAYEQLVGQRQYDLGTAPAEPTYPLDMQAMYFSFGMLRLYEGDAGYGLWEAAIADFKKGQREILGQ